MAYMHRVFHPYLDPFVVIFLDDILVVSFFKAEDGIRYYRVTGVQTCALPIWKSTRLNSSHTNYRVTGVQTCALRSEEHTSELQSHDNIVFRLLLEKKNKK